MSSSIMSTLTVPQIFFGLENPHHVLIQVLWNGLQCNLERYVLQFKVVQFFVLIKQTKRFLLCL